MKLHLNGELGGITFIFNFCHTQIVFYFDPILPWETRRMEVSGVTFRMDASFTAVE